MDGKVVIGVGLDTKSFDKQISKLEDKLDTLEQEHELLKKARPYPQQKEDLLDYEAQIESTKNKIESLKQKQNNLDKAGMSNTKQVMKDISNETSNVLTKIAKWSLAIFSVRSAYMFVRQSVSTLSQYDEKIATDIEYIRYALANALKPIIETIINLVYKLLAYIGYIAKAWFGVTLFADASTKAFKKAKTGIKDTNKEAKKLNKTLAGFDEMNILQENGSTSKGGGGGGVGTPSMDLGNLNDVEIPSWIKWIAEHGTEVAIILGTIGAAILGLKLAKHWETISKIGSSLLGIFDTLGKFSGLQIFGMIVGIAITIAGLVETIGSVLTFVKDPSWSNFVGVLQGLEKVLIGVGIAMIAFNASNPVGWIMIAVAGLTKYVEWIGNALNSDEEKIKTTKTMKEAEKELYNTRKALNSATQNYKNATNEAKKAEKELTNLEKKHKISGKELFDQVLTGQLTYDKMTGTQKKVYEAYLKNLEAQENLKSATDKMTQATKDERHAQEDLAVSTMKYQGKYSDYVKTVIDGYSKGKISAKDMINSILDVMSNMDKKTRQTFAENLPENVKKAFDKAGNLVAVFENGVEISYKSIANAGKTVVKDVGNTAKSTADKLSKEFGTNVPKNIQKSIDKVSELTKKLGGLAKTGAVSIATSVKSSTGKGMKTGGILKAARGVVINQPGRGVPLRSDVIGGEAGREGILPLTDQRAMALLGAEIGRNVVLNTTLNNYMNSRLISREILKTTNEENFGFNGG